MNKFPVLAGGYRREDSGKAQGADSLNRSLLSLSLSSGSFALGIEINSINILYAFIYNKIETIKPNETQVAMSCPRYAFLFPLQPPKRGQGIPDGFRWGRVSQHSPAL